MAVQTAKIDIQGIPIDDYCVMQMSLKMELLHPAELTLSLRGKTAPLTLSDTSQMIGSTIDVTVKTQRRDAKQKILKDDTLTFYGIVFDVQNERGLMGMIPVVTLTAYSPDYLLIDHPHCYSFEEFRLGQIVKQSTKDYSDMLSLSISPFTIDNLPYTVQYNESTYQFLARLAKRHGEYMYHDGKQFVFGQIPNPQNVNLYPDIDILSYRYTLELSHDRYTLAEHDYISNQDCSVNSPSNSTPYYKDTMQDFFAVSPIGVTAQELKTAMDVSHNANQSRREKCHLRTQCANLRMGDSIVIEEYDCSKELKEHHALTIIAISHKLNADGHYENEITAIVSGNNTRPPYMQGDYYPRCETQRAVVTDNSDPEHLGRVRVQFHWQQQQDKNFKSPWLRITQPHSGGNKGFYFIPEVGEEVMIAFEGGNAERPYVVGSLYHGEARPDESHYNEDNNIKAIRTRNGHTIEIHDDGDGGYIRIYDNQKENYILTFSTDEKLIKLESTGNIELYAANDIIMHADNDMKIEVGNNRTLDVVGDERISIGKNQSVAVNEDKNEDVGNDRTDTVGRQYKKSIGEDSDVEIGGDAKTIVANKHTLKADNIHQESSHMTQMYSDNMEQKADSSLKIDGGSSVDIHGDNIRIS